jgi:hypothetical protein
MVVERTRTRACVAEDERRGVGDGMALPHRTKLDLDAQHTIHLDVDYGAWKLLSTQGPPYWSSASWPFQTLHAYIKAGTRR